MNQFDSNLQVASSARLAPSGISSLEDSQRLAVVILGVEQEALLASRILELAKPKDLPILLLGIAPDARDEGVLRRKLITITAFLKDGESLNHGRSPGGNQTLRVEIQMERGRDWIGRIRSFVRPTDVLACYSEERPRAGQRPLSDVLTSTLHMPVYAFEGLSDTERGKQSPISQVVSWVGSLATIGGFFVLQARISVAVQGNVQAMLLLLTLFAEVGLIWLVNSLFAAS